MEKTNQHDEQGRRHGVWVRYLSTGEFWWIIRYRHGKIRGISKTGYMYGTLEGKRYLLVII